MVGRGVLTTMLALALAGCSGSTFSGARLDAGSAAYGVIPAAPAEGAAEYRIGVLDRVDVTVFQEPELSPRNLEVNTAGKITMPLIGDVAAAGSTGPELAALIARTYGARILEHPQVSVTIAQSVSQKVIVQGEVNAPGVYDMKGPTTLLGVMSLAKGETRIAAVKDVAVLRTVAGQRTGALFDVAAIRRGEAQDPQLLGNDVVIVGLSRSKNAWRDLLATAPFLAVFRPLAF